MELNLFKPEQSIMKQQVIMSRNGCRIPQRGQRLLLLDINVVDVERQNKFVFFRKKL